MEYSFPLDLFKGPCNTKLDWKVPGPEIPEFFWFFVPSCPVLNKLKFGLVGENQRSATVKYSIILMISYSWFIMFILPANTIISASHD